MIQFNGLRNFVIFTSLIFAVSGCGGRAQQSNEIIGKNLVTAGDTTQDKTIGEGDQTFRVMAQGAVNTQLAHQQITSPDSVEGKAFLEKITPLDGASLSGTGTKKVTKKPKPQPQVPGHFNKPTDNSALVVGIPASMVGQKFVFGAVITKVSDQNSVDLGDLKLTDLPPFNVTLQLGKDSTGSYSVVLVGCAQACTATSTDSVLQTIPVVGVDQANNKILIDLAPVSADLDFMAMLDPQGTATHLITASTKTVSLDYSGSTLVFDIESHMVAAPVSPAIGGFFDLFFPPLKAPVASKIADPVPTPSPSASATEETVFTTRWYLRPSAIFDPKFDSRTPTDGVGFFETELAKDTQVTHWSKEALPIHYYVKNVPTEYQAAFKSCFDEWNQKLNPIVGKDVFTYEFVPVGDPRLQTLVPGDPRYNIVEWDVVNKASYGGLGPSIANQLTGEEFAASVYIQGPTIEKLYKDWFKVNAQAQSLRASGQNKAADVLLIESRHQIFDQLNDRDARPSLALTYGGGKRAFRVTSQRPELHDPLAERNDFDPLPAGMSYDQYMFGYFHDMLTHELGHNLGLRHNFRGSLGSTGLGEGEVSRSVMEYLGRDYRYLDHVGEYDLMALTYGYTGVKPSHTNWYCTDEDAANPDSDTNSAECSSDDATADPFGWYQMRLGEAVGYLINRGDKAAPTWTVDEMANELKIAVIGMGYYASTADKTSSGWTNFFTGGDRPQDATGVQAYVVSKLRGILCDPALDAESALKEDAAASAKTADNVQALRAKAVEILTPLKVITADDLKCGG